MLKKVILSGVALLGAVFAVPILATPSIDMAVEVETVRLAEECGSASGGDPTQVWEVASSIGVKNTSEEEVKVKATGFFVKFRDSNGSNQISYDVDVIDDGGFKPGVRIGEGESGSFAPLVRAAVSCEATAANLFATLRLEDRDKTYLDGAAFLDNGTPLPMGPAGVIGLAAMLGVAFVLARRLRYAPKPLFTSSRSR